MSRFYTTLLVVIAGAKKLCQPSASIRFTGYAEQQAGVLPKDSGSGGAYSSYFIKAERVKQSLIIRVITSFVLMRYRANKSVTKSLVVWASRTFWYFAKDSVSRTDRKCSRENKW